MKRATRLSLFALLLTLGSISASFAQIAASPPLMNFQGRLAKPDGTPVTDGNYNLQLSIYNASASGTLWWQRSLVNVPVRNGAFAARLDFSGGFQNGATLASLFGTSAVYLEIAVNGGAGLAPRQQFVAVAYAFKADSVADGAIGTGSLANGAVTGAKIANGTITGDKLASNALNGLSWLLSGNSISDPDTQFLGTTNNRALVFRTNNLERMRVLPGGRVGIGTAAARELLDVRGDIAMGVANFPVGLTHEVGANTPVLNLDANFRFTAKDTAFRGGAFRIDTRNSLPLFQFMARPAGSEQESTLAVLMENGRMGIGATAPLSHQLTVRSPDNDTLRLLTGATAGVGAKLNFGMGNSVSLQEDTDNNLTIRADRTAILGGSVGVGTTTPAPNSALSIAGNDAQLNIVPGFHESFPNSDYVTLDVFGDKALRIPDRLNIGGELLSYNPLTLRGDADGSGEASVRILGEGWREIVRVEGNGAINFPLPGSTRNFQILPGRSFENGPFNNTVTLEITETLGFLNIWDHLVVRGNIWADDYYYNSDARFKKNVAVFENGLETILNLRGVTYDWKREEFPMRSFAEGRQFGFIAQEVEKLLPELVQTGQDGYKSVAYAKIVPILVEAVKTLKKENDAQRKRQEAEVAELKARNETLEARINAIEAALRSSK